MPADRKLKVIELGSGRGGLSRYLVTELLKLDKLESFIATNLSETENAYNLAEAKKAGIPEDKLSVIKKNFDDMGDYADGSFDLVVSNDSIIHTADPAKLMQSIARLLSAGGLVVFSDIVEGPTATREQLADLYERYQLINMGSAKVYDETLQACGLKKVLCETDKGEAVWRHFGLQLYSATVTKREKLLGPDGISPEFLEYKINGLHNWLNLSMNGLIEEGWFVYTK